MDKNIDFAAGGYLPASFLDWEAHVSAAIFCLGCNFRCPWCHNGELALSRCERIDLAAVLADIKRRALFLDGVVISGGEPTLQPGLAALMRGLRAVGLPVKLDTNGSRPEVLKALMDEGLTAHFAMDVKAPLDGASYEKLTGVRADMGKITESIELIKNRAPSYEFRTTYVPGLHRASDMARLRKELDDDAHWVVQCFKPAGCLDAAFLGNEAARPDELKKILPGIKIRG